MLLLQDKYGVAEPVVQRQRFAEVVAEVEYIQQVELWHGVEKAQKLVSTVDPQLMIRREPQDFLRRRDLQRKPHGLESRSTTERKNPHSRRDASAAVHDGPAFAVFF